MSNRILVKVSADESSISFRTVTKKRKSPQCFYIQRSEWERFCRESRILSNDGQSFAKLWYEKDIGVLSIRFFWLSICSGDRVTGWEQTVRLPYDALDEFVRRSLTDAGTKQWKALSLQDRRRPKLEFDGAENLHAALSNKTVRRRLVRFLRDQFNWPGADRICFYNDFLPYSFFFREFRGGSPGICGGVILHGQEHMRQAYHSLHT